MVACLDECGHSFWDEWSAVRCPTLIIRAELGLSATTAARMQALMPTSDVVEVGGTRHDLHLENPAEWRDLVLRFLAETPSV